MHLRRAVQRLVRRSEVSGGAVGYPRPLPEKSAGTLIVQTSSTYQEAATKLADFPTLNTVAYRNQVVKTPRVKTHPKVVSFYLRFQNVMRQRGYPFYAVEFYRSRVAQQRLYDAGLTEARGGQSPHNFGCAMRLIHSTRGYDLPRREWEIIGTIGKEVARKMGIQIRWGGQNDPSLWYLRNWQDYRAAMAKTSVRFKDGEETAFFDELDLWIKHEKAPNYSNGKWTNGPYKCIRTDAAAERRGYHSQREGVR